MFHFREGELWGFSRKNFYEKLLMTSKYWNDCHFSCSMSNFWMTSKFISFTTKLTHKPNLRFLFLFSFIHKLKSFHWELSGYVKCVSTKKLHISSYLLGIIKKHQFVSCHDVHFWLMSNYWIWINNNWMRLTQICLLQPFLLLVNTTIPFLGIFVLIRFQFRRNLMTLIIILLYSNLVDFNYRPLTPILYS